MTEFELKVDRKVASSERLVGSKGRRCPLCHCKTNLLVVWRFWDADTGQPLADFCCCQGCNDTKYRMA